MIARVSAGGMTTADIVLVIGVTLAFGATWLLLWHRCFPEFRDHLGHCAFNDCTHLHEPRCGLRAAVGAGAVREERYDSYRRLLTGDLAG